MIIYDLAIVEDKGKFYQVVGCTKNNFDTIINNGETNLKLSSMAYEIIKQNIEQGNLVRIKKPLKSNEVLPGEVDIVATDVDDIQYIRDATLIKCKTLVTPELVKESGYTLYEFMIKNNELCSKGYFISDNNREEKYIEIIETGDEKLIELLETYLEAKDKIDRAFHIKLKLDKLNKALNRAQDAQAIQTLEDDFLAEFYQV